MIDNRKVVNSTLAAPYSAVGAVDVIKGNGSGISGTGFMIDETHMLTAAHMVYIAETSEFIKPQNFFFTPGFNGNETPFGLARAVSIRPAFDFMNTMFIDDYAMITLDRPIGIKSGYFSLMPPKAGNTVQSAGYPGDLDPALAIQYSTEGKVISTGGNIRMEMPVFHGQSGSPLWETVNGKAMAVGVVDGYYSHTRRTTASTDSYAAALDGKEINQIKLWLSQDAGTAAQKPKGRFVDGVDIEWYKQQNPDVANAGVDPHVHYSSNGWKEGRVPNPIFDPAWYMAKNPDIMKAGINPSHHYESMGWKEGRDPSPVFSSNGYLNKNPDVKLAGVNPLDHYLLHGLSEGRAH